MTERNGFSFNEDGYYFSDKIVQSNIATEPILGSRSLRGVYFGHLVTPNRF